jgi:hypothetical protein
VNWSELVTGQIRYKTPFLSLKTFFPLIMKTYLKLKAYDQELSSLKAQVKIYEDKIKELSQDLTNKDELTVTLKCELLSSQEKLKIKSDEVNQFNLE